MPRPEPGPVSDRLMPTLTSASAGAASSSAAAAPIRVFSSFIVLSPGGWLVKGCSTRRHAQRTIEPYDFAVQMDVADDVRRQRRELLGLAQALRERDGR